MSALRPKESAPFMALFRKSPNETASIKGLFVNGHVHSLERKMGPAAVQELERRFGKPVRFEAFEAVPVRDEIAILEASLDILNGGALRGPTRAKEAGVLHFKNFIETPLGGALMRSLPRSTKSFKTLMHNAPAIARIVFEHFPFACDDVQEGVILTLRNCDYPIEHFQGFFEAWMRAWGIEGSVFARVCSEGVHEYRLSFL